jgi:hypothetical protein
MKTITVSEAKTRLSEILASVEGGAPVTDKKWTNENQAWLKVVEGIKRIIEAG